MANSLLSTKAAGSIIKLKESGSPVEFIVCKHDYENGLNGSGRTLIVRKDCYDTRAFSSNNNAFSGSSMDTWLNNTWLKLLDADIQAAISKTKLYYTPGNGNNTVTTLQRAVFLLSVTELGKSAGYANTEGTALASAVCSQLAIAYRNGSAVTQWTRTPRTDLTNYVFYLGSSGNLYGGYYSDFYGSRPAFTLPSTALVDDSGNVTIDLTAHKTLINGTAYTVKSGKCMVGGTVYNILKGRTLINGTGYDITFKPSYDPIFANNTWEQIIAACHNNEVPETWKVADQKPMTINGVDYQIDIIGKNHDDYSDGSGKAPLTFQMHDCYGEIKNMNSSNTNNGGWTSCAMRQTHLPAILALMPIEVQNGIREVNKRTMLSSSIRPKTTADKLFLLSEIEIFGSVTYSYKGEGTQYDYYKADNNNKKKTRNGIKADWWERSPKNSDSEKFCLAGLDGIADAYFASEEGSVAFGFCF